MNLHTPSEQVKTVHSFSAAITAAAVNGSSADCQGFEDAKAIFYSAPSGSGTTSNCKLQESDNDSDWTDVTGGGFTQVTTAGGAKLFVMNIKLSNRERYIRLVQTGAGGSAVGQTYGVIELYNARYNPVTQAETAVSV